MEIPQFRPVKAGRCDELLAELSEFYGVPDCGIRVLAARPLRVRERWTSELFGDYSPDTMLIRVWMRTAVRKEVTSFGIFLSTLCHEFCHHLDFAKFRFPDSWHTRGVLRTGRRPLPWRAGGLRRNVCSGRPCRASDGASTGREPIVAPDVGATKPLGIEYVQFRTDAWASNIALQQILAERTGFVLRA